MINYCCQICNSAFMAKAMCKNENKLRIPKVWGGFFHRVRMSWSNKKKKRYGCKIFFVNIIKVVLFLKLHVYTPDAEPLIQNKYR